MRRRENKWSDRFIDRRKFVHYLISFGILFVSSSPVLAQQFFSRVRPEPNAEKGGLVVGDGKAVYDGRSEKGRKKSLRASGGSAASEKAVENALRWLAKHQNKNGSWSFEHSAGDQCSGFNNPGTAKARLGATGLALLPFLGAGYTHEGKNRYQKTVQSALDYLMRHMREDGGLYDTDGHEAMYSHGMAACALAEAYGMTRDAELKYPTQRALEFISDAQDPDLGGWRYTPGEGSDTSVVGWQVMALRSGLLSVLNVPEKTGRNVTKWLNRVQYDRVAPDTGIGSKYGYNSRSGGTAATISIGLLCRNFLGTPKNDPGLRKGVEWIASEGPDPAEMYSNYYATMVLFQNDGPDGRLWKVWNKAMRDQLLHTQQKQGQDAGSWYFDNTWAKYGGRVYDTALSALTLEVYYRYLPIYQK